MTEPIKLPSISCAVCKKPVDRVEVYENEMDLSLIVRAYCHGMRDEMSLPLNTMREYGREILSQTGVAFQHQIQLEKT